MFHRRYGRAYAFWISNETFSARALPSRDLQQDPARYRLAVISAPELARERVKYPIAAAEFQDLLTRLQVAGKHFDPPRPTQFPRRSLPIPNFPGPVRQEIFPVLNLAFQAVLHLMLSFQINLILPAANPSIRSRIRPCFQRSMLVEP